MYISIYIYIYIYIYICDPRLGLQTLFLACLGAEKTYTILCKGCISALYISICLGAEKTYTYTHIHIHIHIQQRCKSITNVESGLQTPAGRPDSRLCTLLGTCDA